MVQALNLISFISSLAASGCLVVGASRDMLSNFLISRREGSTVMVTLVPGCYGNTGELCWGNIKSSQVAMVTLVGVT